MRVIRMMSVAAVAGAIVWASAGIGAQDNTMREARDRDEIEALMWKYTRALDTADADTYASTYTENGQFSAGGANATKGRAALTKMIADIKARQTAAAAKGETPAPMYHMTLNSRLTFIDKDHARIEAYYQTVFGAVGQNTPPRLAAAGRSVDLLVRQNGKADREPRRGASQLISVLALGSWS